MNDYSTYYADIAKPFFAPEPWVFGFAWGIIYPLIAIAGVLIVRGWYHGAVSRSIVIVFGINIVANLLFTPLQLNYPEAPWATFDIVVVLVTLGYLIRYFWTNNKLIFGLLLPYLLWGAFATILQITIYTMNF